VRSQKPPRKHDHAAPAASKKRPAVDPNPVHMLSGSEELEEDAGKEEEEEESAEEEEESAEEDHEDDSESHQGSGAEQLDSAESSGHVSIAESGSE
jgi:hypothetical protein